MSNGRPRTFEIALTETERSALAEIAGPRSLPAGLVRRAWVILLSAAGEANRDITIAGDLNGTIVGHWRRRYRELGLTVEQFGHLPGRRAATFHHKKNGKPMVRSTRVSKTNGSTGKRDLVEYVDKQLRALFPDRNKPRMALKRNIDEAMDRMLYSLSHVRLVSHKHFNHLHSDVYAQFLYFLSNTIWTNDEDRIAASKLFYLNKALHGINCMYTTQLPDVFLLIHCVGSVLGNAVYSNFFVCCQNVTVGTDRQKQPHISEGVYMGPGSSIIGDSHVGPLTILSVNATIINQTTAGNSVVISSNSALITKPLRRNIIYDLYFQNQ